MELKNIVLIRAPLRQLWLKFNATDKTVAATYFVQRSPLSCSVRRVRAAPSNRHVLANLVTDPTASLFTNCIRAGEYDDLSPFGQEAAVQVDVYR